MLAVCEMAVGKEEEEKSAGPIYPKGAARTLKGFSEGLQHGLSVLLHGPSPKPSEGGEGSPKEQTGQGGRARGAAAQKHLPEYRAGGRKTKLLGLNDRLA